MGAPPVHFSLVPGPGPRPWALVPGPGPGPWSQARALGPGPCPLVSPGALSIGPPLGPGHWSPLGPWPLVPGPGPWGGGKKQFFFEFFFGPKNGLELFPRALGGLGSHFPPIFRPFWAPPGGLFFPPSPISPYFPILGSCPIPPTSGAVLEAGPSG